MVLILSAAIVVLISVEADRFLNLVFRDAEKRKRICQRRPDDFSQILPIGHRNSQLFKGVFGAVHDPFTGICQCPVQIKNNRLISHTVFLTFSEAQIFCKLYYAYYIIVNLSESNCL